MIQRIQTLYLLLVVVLTGLALWLPLVDFTVGADTCTLTAFDGVSGGCSGCHLSVAAGDDFPFQAPPGADPVMCRRVGAPRRCRSDDGNLFLPL